MTKTPTLPVPAVGGSFIRMKDGTLAPNSSDPETAARIAETAGPAEAASDVQKTGPKSKLKEA